ncbi:MAG: hypothetical protein LBQ20_07580 [Rhodanobacter sp.]|jgi:hypothetical protein|nr:hypothetical protein [Rhodanobacter sp.]
MSGSFRDLDRLLVAEKDAAVELEVTAPAEQLREARNELLAHVRKVGRGGDLSSIIGTERAIAEGDLLRYANSREMEKSLTMALSEMTAIEKHMAVVAEPKRYQAVNEAYSLPKNRKNGLPYDEARQAMASHPARLGNMDKARLSMEEKSIIDARKDSMKAAQKLYEQMQAKALGVDLAKAQAHGLSA